jgi:hypothetical protein
MSDDQLFRLVKDPAVMGKVFSLISNNVVFEVTLKDEDGNELFTRKQDKESGFGIITGIRTKEDKP